MQTFIENMHEMYNILEEKPWFKHHVFQQISALEYDIQKSWIDKVDVEGKSINILNSGFGFFVVPLCLESGASKVTLYDMDPLMHEIGYRLHDRWKNQFDQAIMDIVFDNQRIGLADIWVNTSCEHNYPTPHIIKFDEIQEEVKIVLSGNALTKRGHINHVNSTDDLIEMYDILMVTDTFEKEYIFQEQQFKQYTVIGNATPNLHDLY